MWYFPHISRILPPFTSFPFCFFYHLSIPPFVFIHLPLFLHLSLTFPFFTSPLKHACRKTITLCLIPKAHIREYTCEPLLWSKQSVPNLIFRLTTDFMNTAPYSVTAKDYFASPSRCCDYYNSSVETKIRVSLIF